MFEVTALLLASLINGILGFVVYTKNPKSATNRLFIILTWSFIAWSIVNYISVHPVFFPQLTWIRLVLFCAAFLCLAVYLTFTTFPSYTLQGSSRLRKLAVGYTAFVMLLTLTPFVFRGLSVADGKASPEPNAGIVLFMVLVVSMLGGGIWNLVSKYRHATSKLKMQLRFVLLGLAGTFGLIFLTNFALVVLFNNSSLVPLGPTYTLIFSAAMAYAIIKHRLFDIRRTAARGVAYLLTLGFVGVVYTGAVFGITAALFGESDTTASSTRLVYTVLALVLAFSFQKIKLFFDRLSNRIFYKDAYDPQRFLDELNKVLVSEVNLEPLLRKSQHIITANLKSEECLFVMSRTNYAPERTIGNHNSKFRQVNIADIRPGLIRARQKVIVADYLEEKDQELQETLSDAGLALVVRLVPSLDYTAQQVGEILLGPKRSGDPYSQEDIRLLEIIANELVIAVENALRFEEIQNFNLTLQAKVDEATRKLRKTNEKLKELDETKDDFISMASHQLRTPLTSVKGYISMVLEGDAGNLNETQRKLLEQSFFSSQRMVYLIADLLNVSRLKTGKFIIEPTPVNLAEMVGQEMEQLKETASAKGLTLTYEKPKAFPALMLDETKTRQVIMNFADNAIYYTPAGGHIKVQLTETPASVELRITDDGIGVPKHEQHHLFTKFYRAGNARKARPDGTGLGLFMAKKVVVGQGGAIIFESEEGKGSTFGFVFSKTKLAPSGVPNPEEHQAATAKA
jgi:signal transduction histidine kinase